MESSHACSGSPTPRGPLTASENAASGVAFRCFRSRRHPGQASFRGSIAGLRAPLSTLRCALTERQRMTRGHRDSLRSRCRTLSFPSSCRLSGAFRKMGLAAKPRTRPRTTPTARTPSAPTSCVRTSASGVAGQIGSRGRPRADCCSGGGAVSRPAGTRTSQSCGNRPGRKSVSASSGLSLPDREAQASRGEAGRRRALARRPTPANRPWRWLLLPARKRASRRRERHHAWFSSTASA